MKANPHYKRLQLKSLFALFSLFCFAGAAMADSIPTLAKEWKGSTSFTSSGSVSKFKNGKSNEWSYHDGANRTLTVVRQEGRHVELLYKTPEGALPRWVGVISKDGKQLQIAGRQDHILLTISGDTMSGCGTARGDDDGFKDYINNYGAFCLDFKAVK
jgi:hypothetical protein